jgi:glycosyltransferase involved in cell wall biosynthesis
VLVGSVLRNAADQRALECDTDEGQRRNTSGAGARRLNLLLITAGCDSNAVGEAWSSFQWVSRIAARHNVTLLASRNSHKAATARQLPGVRVIEWPDPPLFEKWERFNSMLKPGYVNFYVHARRWLKNQLRSGETFDLVHQISPLALRYPSPAAGLGMPLVIGPLGGSLENPKAFSAELSKVPWYTKLRSMDEWRLRRDPWLRHTYSSADRIIGVAPYVKGLLGDLPSHQVEFMSETGVTYLPAPRSLPKETGRQLRLLFVGRVIRSKGVRDAVRAIAKLADLDGLKFDVVGDGDDLAACKNEARDLGVSDRITFHGRMPRKEVDTFYAQADVFVFPSFREPSGNVVIEAMSHGLAMVVADRGGPGFVVDDSCGFRIPVVEPEQFATGIADCIRKLAQEPALIAAMGAAGREKAKQQFLWDAKIDRIEELYHSVLAQCETSKALAG